MLPVTPAVIEFAIDPVVRIGDQGVRLETILIGVVLLVALLLAVWIGQVTPVDVTRPADDLGPSSDEHNHLRADDLLYLAIAVLPGAVVGGRIGYALNHVDYYGANPGAILDPAQGGLALSLAVVGGTLTAAGVARLLNAPIQRWLHAVTLPLLFALAGGKLALVLGGDGQGLPSDLPWATAYAGFGPWGSLLPEAPSHPAQAYEAILVFLVLAGVVSLLAGGGFARRDGRVFLLAIGGWAAARFLVAFTWRDQAVAGPLRMEQLVSLALAAAMLGVLVVRTIRERSSLASGGAASVEDGAPGGDLPDPDERPSF